MIPSTGGIGGVQAVAALLLTTGNGEFQPILVVAFGLVALVGYGIYRDGAADRELSDAVETTPTEPIGAIDPGRAETEGIVRDLGETVRQPFGDDESVYARFRISESFDDDEETGPTASDSGEKAVPFAVEDDSGSAVIQAVDDVEFRLSHKDTSRVTGGTFPGDEYEAFVLGEHEDWDTSISKRQLDPQARQRYVQEWLPVGEEVYVFGRAVQADEADGSEDVEFVPDEETGRLVVSDYDPDKVQSRFGRHGLVKIVIGGAIAIVSLALLADHVLDLAGIARF